MPCSSRSCSVFASGRAVTTNSWLRASSPMIPAKRLMCGELEISSQIRIARVACGRDFGVAFEESVEALERIGRERLGMAHHYHAIAAPQLVLAVGALEPSRLRPVDRHRTRRAGEELSSEIALAAGNRAAVSPGPMARATGELARGE